MLGTKEGCCQSRLPTQTLELGDEGSGLPGEPGPDRGPWRSKGAAGRRTRSTRGHGSVEEKSMGRWQRGVRVGPGDWDCSEASDCPLAKLSTEATHKLADTSHTLTGNT